MRRLRFVLPILLIFIAAAIIFFIYRRATAQTAVGPAIALCPGPDAYGYACESGAGYAYIDAAADSLLYTDDGVVELALPFPFTFYGTTYTEIYASSNGNLQFNGRNADFNNVCLQNGVADGMGDLIAPYWDDFDLTYEGYLQTETTGEAPNRIFTIEWDNVLRYGAESGDSLTFEAQLFEGSSDIVFLYEDTIAYEGQNGGSATIGLQSELQGLALQFSCDQPAVANAQKLLFSHPDKPDGSYGLETLMPIADDANASAAKGETAVLIQALNQGGAAALPQLRRDWLNQRPSLLSESMELDLTGNGREELIILRRGNAQQPQRSQLIVLTPNNEGAMELLLDLPLSDRQTAVRQPTFIETADLTGDGRFDLLLGDETRGQLFVLARLNDGLQLLPVPEQCQGSVIVKDNAIVRNGCPHSDRYRVKWNGETFDNNE